MPSNELKTLVKRFNDDSEGFDPNNDVILFCKKITTKIH